MKKISGFDHKEKFLNCNLLQDQIEGRLIAVNKKFLAMNWNSEGEILITDSSKPIKINPFHTIFQRNYSKTLDLEFSPFNDNLLASGHENQSVVLWKIPDNDFKNLGNKISIYNKHEDKVSFVNFNPIFSDIICSSSSSIFNGSLHIWNIEKSNKFKEIKIENNPVMISWNPNGNLIGLTSKTSFNVFDYRTKERVYVNYINQIPYSSKFVWNDDNLFTTISKNKNNEKMLKLWDMKKFKEEIYSIKLDSYSNEITPFIDYELKLIYTIGYEEKFIDIYDYSMGTFKKLKRFESSDASTCSILFNKNCLGKKKYEVDRFARYSRKNNNIYYISFYLNNEEEDYNYFKMDNEKWNISHQGKIFLEGNKNFNISLSLY